MTAVALRELLDYSDHERRKWRAWIGADPSRLDVAFQNGGRFPTIGSLFDHIFLVERRHLSRLEGAAPPDSSGVQPGNWAGLFEYADRVRADLRRYLTAFDEETGRERMTVAVQSGTQTLSKRWLATHILLHEVRHLAQIAYAVRSAGHAPPGQHDLFYFPER